MPSETHNWSVSIGVWKGVPVHLHLSLILAVILLIGCQLGLVQGMNEEPRVGARGSLSTLVLMLMVGGLVYLVPMLLQWMGVLRPSQAIRRICLLPCGAYYEWQVDSSPNFRVRTYAIGLLANAAFLSLALLGFAGWFRPDAIVFWQSLYPWHPQLPQWFNLEASLMGSLVWFNAVAMWLRLIPVAPMDLGRLLSDWAHLRYPNWPMSQRSAIVFLLGSGSVVVLVGASYLIMPDFAGPAYSLGVWPLMGGLVLLFFARREYLHDVQLFLRRRLKQVDFDDPEFANASEDFDESSTYEGRAHNPKDDFDFADLSDPTPKQAWEASEPQDAGWEEWMEENRTSRQQARDDHAAAEELLLDGILLKVSATGIASLTGQEREVLDRVSQIYRRRREIRH